MNSDTDLYNEALLKQSLTPRQRFLLSFDLFYVSSNCTAEVLGENDNVPAIDRALQPAVKAIQAVCEKRAERNDDRHFHVPSNPGAEDFVRDTLKMMERHVAKLKSIIDMAERKAGLPVKPGINS